MATMPLSKAERASVERRIKEDAINLPKDKAELKRMYVDYYRSVPIQKYAAMSIGKTEETIINWRNEDPEFSNKVEAARSVWVRNRLLDAKAEFALERVEREIFRDLKGVDITSGDKPIQFINQVPIPPSEGTEGQDDLN